jgi:hypothetical protein
LLALAVRSTRIFPFVLWLFNLWGMFDLLRAAALGPIYNVPPYLHATFFIPILGVPLLLWTHIVLITLLVRTHGAKVVAARHRQAASHL